MAKSYSHKPFSDHPWVSPFPVAMFVSPGHFKCPRPRNDADFAILSEIIFGAPLRLSELWMSWGPFEREERVGGKIRSYTIRGVGRAEIAQCYDDFATLKGGFSKYCIRGYDRLSWFWQTVTGPMNTSRSLTCTGIRVLDYRHERRLRAWIEDRRKGSGSPPSAAFVRLAHTHGVGENIVDRNRPPEIGVLTGGRVDAAQAALI